MCDTSLDLLNALFDGVYFVDPERRITYWNRGAERIAGFSAADVVGRVCSDNILMHMSKNGDDLCRGECPLAQTLRDGKPREADVFLHHKDGHRVPVSVRILPRHDAEGSIIGAVEVFSETSVSRQLLEELQDLRTQSMRDPLTGLGNRRAAEQEFRRRMAELHRYGTPFCLLFADIDHFKQVNDTYGHDVGDRVLVMVGKTLRNALRGMDSVARWGGEEFLMILPQLDSQSLKQAAERLRIFVQSSPLHVGEGLLRVTVSVGGALAYEGDGLDSLVERADTAMYQAKQAGRNRIMLDLRTADELD